jgi:hypothetical protein
MSVDPKEYEEEIIVDWEEDEEQDEMDNGCPLTGAPFQYVPGDPFW